jgi:antitoxin component of MazEF toxin-antitoxin module
MLEDTKKLRKIGNSNCVILDRAYFKMLNIDIDKYEYEFTVSVHKDKIVLKPKKGRNK